MIRRLASALRRAFFVALLCAVLVPATAQAAGSSLLVFAAASLKNAMDDVATAYEQSGDVEVRVSYAGSSTLARQIQQGAPAEVYVSANQAWMDELEKGDLIDAGSRIDLLRNALVLVAPENSSVAIELGDDADLVAALGTDRYLAMANTEAVPAGIYGRQALQSLGLWSSLQGHIAQADDVRAALALVARGEAPLGVVYSSDAVAEDKVRVVDTFAADSHDPIVYPAAVLQGVDNPAARSFMAFLQQPEARQIFQQWGFEVVDAVSK